MLTVEWIVKPEDLARYAWVSGDINPIHFDDEAAKSLGLPGTIVHGLYAHARLMIELTKFAQGKPYGAFQNTHTKFSAMMPCPGTYQIQVQEGSDGQSLVAKVLNSAGAMCVEINATLDKLP